MHAHPATMHAPWQPCTPPGNHAHPPQLCMPPKQPCMPPQQPRMPLLPHQPCAPPWQPHMPPDNHACPLATTHGPLANMHASQPCTLCPTTTHAPLATTHAPPVNRMTNWCKNITLPQTSLAGGKNRNRTWTSIRRSYFQYHSQVMLLNCSVIETVMKLLSDS